MGILSIFGKKDQSSKENLVQDSINDDVKVEEKKESAAQASSEKKFVPPTGAFTAFSYGVQDTFGLKDSNDLVVIGKVKGTIKASDDIYITNVGDDKQPIVKTKIVGLEIDKKRVESASDCLVAICVKNGAMSCLKKGSVIHSESASNNDKHAAYISALGDMFILRQDFTFDEIDLDNMSITDCAEALKLYGWYISREGLAETEDQRAEYRKKIEVVAKEMCKKILAADEIYCVCNTITGEPHLFSKTIKQEQGFFCTPPEILLVPAAYASVYKETYSQGHFEFKRIINGPEGTGIKKFLEDAFYVNGALGASVISDMSGVPAAKLVAKPDYSNVAEADIPVTNPELERWILLLTQLGQPKSEEDEIIYKLYFRFMSREITKAKLIVPAKVEGKLPAPNKDGVTVITEGTKVSFSTIPSKDGRDAVRMYTDYRKFRAEFTSEWEAMVGPLSDMIKSFDCAVNMSKTYRAGCYINKDMYEEMKELGKWEKH